MYICTYVCVAVATCQQITRYFDMQPCVELCIAEHSACMF